MDAALRNNQYIKFCAYGFLKNLRFFDAFFILYLLEKGLPFTQIGILYAIRELIINIFEIPSGIIADTWGRKNSLVGSFILYISSFAIFYLSDGFWIFLIAFVLFGIGDAFRTGTHKGMIMDYLKLNNWSNHKIMYYGHTRSWSQKGSALSALIAGFIVFYSGSYQYIFLYSIIPYLLNLLLVSSYPKGLNHSSNKKSDNSPGIWATTLTLFKLIKKPNVLSIINTTAVHSAYLKAVKDYIQPLMVNVALMLPLLMHVETKQKNGIVIGVIYFFIYLATSRASRLSSKVAEGNKRNIARITLLIGFLLGAVTGLFYITELWVISIIAFVGIYIIENVRKPILTGYVADSVPNENLTSVISAISLLKTLITALIALLIGVFADQFGIGVSFVIVSLLLVVGTFLVTSLSSRTNVANK